MSRSTLLALLALAGACADDGAASLGDLQSWLAAGHHRAWHCEPEPHAGRSPSAHSRNRICSNDALSASTTGAFPVGAATVKEIYRGSEIAFHAVMRKMTDGTGGDSWYWYEADGDTVYANGQGDGTCTGCHAGAPRDSVFTIIR
jgi:hypothetical protein